MDNSGYTSASLGLFRCGGGAEIEAGCEDREYPDLKDG